jgi:hypothetical protein
MSTVAFSFTGSVNLSQKVVASKKHMPLLKLLIFQQNKSFSRRYINKKICFYKIIALQLEIELLQLITLDPGAREGLKNSYAHG